MSILALISHQFHVSTNQFIDGEQGDWVNLDRLFCGECEELNGERKWLYGKGVRWYVE